MWDYVLVTASDEGQAGAYEAQLALRRELGLLAGVREVLVVPDPDGQRVGSGGSTACCLIEVLGRELEGEALGDPEAWQEALGRLRILIVHGGGDSMRLPAYGPCGKLFIPVPGESDSCLGWTLFDRQLPTYLALPPLADGRGQVVVTAGDVLVEFDPSEVTFAADGVTGLGCFAAPDLAARHGVYCANGDGEVRRFLQKPTPVEQAERGAVDRCGRSILDVGVLSLDAASAVTLLRLCDVGLDGDTLTWNGTMGKVIADCGMDLYREVCCALGTETTAAQYSETARAAGSRWGSAALDRSFRCLHLLPFRVQVVPQCRFLHFGTTRQLLTSGVDLKKDAQGPETDERLVINTSVEDGGAVSGSKVWVEGCRVRAPLDLRGENVVVGAEVDEPLALPPRACLDVVSGRSRSGESIHFVRCYGVTDRFKDTPADGATFCGRPALEWLESVGASPQDVWDGATPPERCRVWDAQLFPAEADPSGYHQWLWMFEPEKAAAEDKAAWREADRYSLAEIAKLADQHAFQARRAELRTAELRWVSSRLFQPDSRFSAADLAHALANSRDQAAWLGELLCEAHWHYAKRDNDPVAAPFAFSRLIHTLASALERLAQNPDLLLLDIAPGLEQHLKPQERAWLAERGLAVEPGVTVGEWADRARAAAFQDLERRIVTSRTKTDEPPRSFLRSDEIVWGRVPARLDFGGGWTDTPPYSLEHGGCVINAAVNLNGQPPIQAYARVVSEPVIRISSIDLGQSVEISDLDELLDYRQAESEFALAKAAIALSGLSPDAAPWPGDAALPDILERFGGGIELTTLAAVPKGSGLGTSSIMGAVLLAVLRRVTGRACPRKELFHDVLRLEQALTTGGGWQDQVGGVVDGVKVISTDPGLVPDPRVHYVPPDVLDPPRNGSQTLLYYTGITRLARNILGQVVGRFLDRDRTTVRTLGELRRIVSKVADAMSRKDLRDFGELVSVVWELNKQIDPGSTNDEVDALLERVQPHVHGAKLLGAGGGGFLLMVCKSPEDAAAVRQMLAAEPPNERARFFDFDVSREGLVVTVC